MRANELCLERIREQEWVLICSNTLLLFKLLSLVVSWGLDFKFRLTLTLWLVRARVTVGVKFKVGVRAKIAFFFVCTMARK